MERDLKNAARLNEREIQEIQELNEWFAQYREEEYGKSMTFCSNELGGHMELRKAENMHLIGPSQEEVQRLLKTYGKKLGIEYVIR
ncbi:MAG: hypothetical protein Q4E24_15780 [bacterium]|nr:hypothetical protein [bacterium]